MPARGLAFAILSTLIVATARAGEPTAAEVAFVRHVQPALRAKCVACHGADAADRKGGLDVTSRAALLRGGETSATVLVPGDPEGSDLLRAVRWADPDLRMPPKRDDRLAADRIDAIRDWIAAGAPWPDDAAIAAIRARYADGVRVATTGGLSPEWSDRLYNPADLWAYRPVATPPVPAVSRAVATPIDAFLQARMDAAGLAPAPPADRRTLLRRVTYDLTGLPPSADELRAYLDDPAPDALAFGRVVDRLLASPHYGEHWGRHWLDVVRYADSSGFANDYERGNAWRYRDYAVRALNADVPYDRFVRDQVAGDEIDPADPERLVAAGFLRMGPWELTGMEVARVARQRFLDDVVDGVGQVFLAQPLQCARCHDHKFDPIPTRDYYRMQAVFAATQPAERPAAFLPAENPVNPDRDDLLARREAAEAELDRLDALALAAAGGWFRERQIDPAPFERALAAVRRSPGRRRAFEAARLRLLNGGTPESRVPPRHLGFSTLEFGLDRIARKNLERLAWEFDRDQPFALSVYDGPTPDLKAIYTPFRPPAVADAATPIDASHILVGGDPFSPGEPVTPGGLSALDPAFAAAGASPADFADAAHGRRRALADWIASPHNPLTARVMVNRVWLWHFGRPLVGTPNNFGVGGAKPTHPELLDWLASRFVADGYSLKSLHRLILASDAYRRSIHHPDPAGLARRDPPGVLHAAFGTRRLTADEIRDSMLAVSGELNRAVGGVPVRPELPPDVALQPRQVMGTFAPAWQPSPRPADRHRRSLYALRLRGLRDPFLEVLNEPSPDLSCEARDTSTVTPQAFALFNGQGVHDRALALADRLVRISNDDAATITGLFRAVHGRDPRPDEHRLTADHWAAMTRRHEALHPEPSVHPREVERQAVEENTGEPFRFVERLGLADRFVPDLEPHRVDPRTRGLAEVALVLLNSNEFLHVD
jgi:mono/diheme cytochrome c family protein